MPIGTPTQKMARQSHCDSTPPISRPRNEPATAATMLTPSAMPRWLLGNASVRIAADDAINIAPPTPWITRQPISHSAPRAQVERIERQRDRRDREDPESDVVDAHPPVDVTQAAEQDNEHRGDDQVAHQHPQQVADVARRQRVQPDATEDRRQRDQHDRRVDGRKQSARPSCWTARPTCSAGGRGPIPGAGAPFRQRQAPGWSRWGCQSSVSQSSVSQSSSVITHASAQNTYVSYTNETPPKRRQKVFPSGGRRASVGAGQQTTRERTPSALRGRLAPSTVRT